MEDVWRKNLELRAKLFRRDPFLKDVFLVFRWLCSQLGCPFGRALEHEAQARRRIDAGGLLYFCQPTPFNTVIVFLV